MEIDNQNSKKPWWRDSILIFAKVSAWIAVPIVFALFIGKALDRNFGTKPWLFLACIGISFFLSLIGIYRTTKKEMQKISVNKSGSTINPNNINSEK